MKKGKDIFNCIKLEQKGASAKLLQLQIEANEILHSEQENYQSYLSAKRIGEALAEIKERVVELEDSPRKSEFLNKLDSILPKLREYYQFHQPIGRGRKRWIKHPRSSFSIIIFQCWLRRIKESRIFRDWGGLPQCGVKVSGCTMLPEAL